jgi:hypothetical protein
VAWWKAGTAISLVLRYHSAIDSDMADVLNRSQLAKISSAVAIWQNIRHKRTETPPALEKDFAEAGRA